jgi:hypothetical protein
LLFGFKGSWRRLNNEKIYVLFNKYNRDDQIKEGKCRTHEGDEICLQNFVGKLKGRGSLEDLGVDRRKTLN